MNTRIWQNLDTPELQAKALDEAICFYNVKDGALRGEFVPSHTHEALTSCVEYGYEPGSFLKSVLDNDLVLAAGRADETNRRHLAFIAQVIEWVGFREWYAERFE